MEFVEEDRIRLDKEVTELEEFVFSFIEPLQQHTDYVIVSGYIPILFGRARATEDIDIFIPQFSQEAFTELFTDLEEEGFWCLNTDTAAEAYEYLQDGVAIRFAEEGEAIPNIELKFPHPPLEQETLDDTLTVEIAGHELVISAIERQIAFKRYYLKSEKDREDAQHLEEVFKEHLDKEEIQQYKEKLTHAQA